VTDVVTVTDATGVTGVVTGATKVTSVTGAVTGVTDVPGVTGVVTGVVTQVLTGQRGMGRSRRERERLCRCPTRDQ